MADKSDHNKPFTDINKYIPEVYRSAVGTSVFDVAFNRHLTKDDTTRVTGFVGDNSASAIVDRRIKEHSPHRQAYQLAPSMYSSMGTSQSALSFKAFQQQLSLMGVNIDRLPSWGSTTQFNWVPPVNIDMVINYQNYFWRPSATDPAAPPQYLTIENRSNKAHSRVESYSNVIAQNGENFAVTKINLPASELVISQPHTDLFAPGFVFYTKGSFYTPGVQNPNLQDKFWNVLYSSYDAYTNETTIGVEEMGTHEPIIQLIDGVNPNAGLFEGDWYYDTLTNRLNVWNTADNEWKSQSTSMILTVSLTERLDTFRAQANCSDNQDFGWDVTQWDDNFGETWNDGMLSAISSPSAPASPVDGDVWYDTTQDELKQYTTLNGWTTTIPSFSVVLSNTKGTSFWNLNTACDAQEHTGWSTQNQWVHKSQLSSTSGASRAQLPILEYDSTVELNEWIETTHAWKYRSEPHQLFSVSSVHPNRLELEPIKGYYAAYSGGTWTIYLFHNQSTMNRDVDYSDIFVPGYKFRVTDDLNASYVYTTATAEYREITDTDSDDIKQNVGTNVMCTIITITEPMFDSIQVAGDAADTLHTRIEPVRTSLDHPWRGYHLHWVMDEQATTTSPTAHQQWTLYKQRSYDNVTALLPGSIPEFPSTFASGVYGVAHQEYTIGNATTTHVPLHPTLRYDSASPQQYATPNSNEIRVYVNDVRQRGNYIEQTELGSPNYTVIGQTTYSTGTVAKIPYVTEIVFDDPLEIFDVVRIEVGPSPLSRLGNVAVPVRTIEDEAEFTLAVASGTQPVYRSMTRYYHIGQTKTTLNQYPLFNVYDIATSEVVDANPIFGFKENEEETINPYIQRRISASADNKEYIFEQHLIDRDDNVLTAYKCVHEVSEYWYSPLLNKLFWWDGYAWADRVPVAVTVNASACVAIRRLFATPTKPTTALDKAIYFNTTDTTLYQYVSGTWTPMTSTVTINGSDPMLRTVWRHGPLANETYTPAYVDDTRQPIPFGNSNGDWEVVDQWMYNPEHANKKEVNFSQLTTHFRTILEQQPPIPGLQGGGIYTLTQDEFNYGLGGTIKEHNDSFDTLISAVNVNNVTPLGVIDFAAREYESCLLRIRDIFNTNIVSLLQTYTKDTFVDLVGNVSNNVINTYELNDFTTTLYGDSSSYDATTGSGIKNWISTIPMFNLGPKYQPHASTVGNNVYVLHHDGHRSIVTYTAVEQDRVARSICRTPDSRAPQGTLGIVSTQSYPTNETEFTTLFGGSVRPGVYWFTTGNARKLYRLNAYDVSSTPPSFYDNVGTELPDGVMYFNKQNKLVYKKEGLAWVATSGIASDITALWTEINLAELLGGVILDVEQRLYGVCPEGDNKFAYDSLTPNESERAVFNTLMKQRYDDYVSSHDITTPMVNDEYVAGDAFTWNYAYSMFDVDDKPRVINGVEELANEEYHVSSYQELYTRVYGTPYPHLEPWKLQNYYDKPTWWDDEYLETNGSRRWKHTYSGSVNTDVGTGMWENIRIGAVPAGRNYPDGDISTGNTVVDGKAATMPTYRYFSVNISNVTVAGYAPDALFPPYFASPSADPQVRSLFKARGLVGNVEADYAFGDVGPAEWAWLTSAQRAYDYPAVAFTMQPAKFLHAAFGPVYTHVDKLQLDVLFKQVYSHEDVLFHGDIYDSNKQYLVRGLNQWYVNYNRYTGFDTNTTFRELWAGWNPKMTYQFDGIIDTSTFEIANKYFDVTDKDYNLLLINNGVIRDTWADAFEVSLLAIPPAIVQYNNQTAWKMVLDSLAAISRNITYYGVRHYPTTVNVPTNTFTANSASIVRVTPSSNHFYVAGDHTLSILHGTTIGITGDNQGTYTVTSSAYDTNTNRTRLTVQEPIQHSTINGVVQMGITLPWATGDVVVMSSSKFLPPPIKPDTAYYIIRVSTSEYKLAETYQDAIDGNEIDITSTGDGVSYVAELDSSFNVFGGARNTTELWFHYAIDKTDVRTFAPPITIVGMQTLVNIIDGYAAYQTDAGIVNNGVESSDFDPTTGRLVDWQLETERFIDWAYGLRQSRIRISDRYDVSVNTTTSTFTFTGMTPYWMSGTAVTLISTGSVPAPLIDGATYYIVSTGVMGTFKLSTSANALDQSSIVEITNGGSGQLYVGLYNMQRAYPRFEINPYRNNIWLDTPTGVLSNVIEGPYSDIRVQQTIFDQYSRPLGSNHLVVYRRDKQSRIAVRPEIANDIDPIYNGDPYNYIHVGGGHFFIEGYEHFLVFENYTTGGALIYDPFVGLFATRFNLDYLEKEDYTLRPTLGGHYLNDQHFERNIEGSIGDMRMYYDVHGIPETSEAARRARGLLGFKGRTSFLDSLNVNQKAQFMFYRGMLQAKGSVNSVQAYINSRRFIDAKHDEFWAWKVAEYGDTHPRVYPEIKLFATDGLVDDIRLTFLSPVETIEDTDVAPVVEQGFIPVTDATVDRWINYPEQIREIETPLFLDAEVSSKMVILCSPTPPAYPEYPAFQPTDITYWFNTTYGSIGNSGYDADVNKLYAYDETSRQWSTEVKDVVYIIRTGNKLNVYVALSESFDDIRLTRKQFDISTPSTQHDYDLYNLVLFTKVSSNVIKMRYETFVGSWTSDRPLAITTMYSINQSAAKTSPAKLIDNKANVVLQDVPIWHPARGQHSPTAIHNVDLQQNADPARYNYSINPDMLIQKGWQESFWNHQEVGTTWLDSNYLGYMPYYDDKVYPDVNDRLYNWGALAPWSDVKVYQWVQSTVPPQSWTGSGIPRDGLFVRPRDPAVNVGIDPSTSQLIIDTPAHAFSNGDIVLFVSGNDGVVLPKGISSTVQYIVSNRSVAWVDGVFVTYLQLTHPATNAAVEFTNVGTGQQQLIKAFNDADWAELKLVHDRVTFAELAAPWSLGTTNINFPFLLPDNEIVWTPTIDSWFEWKPWANMYPIDGIVIADVYKNGILVEAGVPVEDAPAVGSLSLKVTLSTALYLNECDVIDIVRPRHELTPDEEEFDPNREDDGTKTKQWKVDYQFSTNELLTNAADVNSTHSTKYYYFWVEQSTNRNVNGVTSLSLVEIADQIRKIPTPHLIVQRPKLDPVYEQDYPRGSSVYDSHLVPVKYRDAIVRGIAPYVNDDNRYVIRFTRDLALRNKIQVGEQKRKNKHEEWTVIRKAQMNTIPRELWDRLTEALMGYKLNNNAVRVPTLERELYDAMYGTDTQYGLGEEQTFVDKDMGIATIIHYLTDPTHDFTPTDIDYFFATHDFSTPEGIRVIMDTIYTTFSSQHVNAMWFSVLDDSLSLRAKYKELFKTSWIALHGIRVLDVGGMFDD